MPVCAHLSQHPTSTQFLPIKHRSTNNNEQLPAGAKGTRPSHATIRAVKGAVTPARRLLQTLNVDTPRNPSAALFGMYPREMKRASTQKLAHRVLTVALLTVPQATHNPNIHQATTEETKHAPSTQRKTLQICATSNASYEPDARRGARHRDHTFYGAVYTNCPKG